MKQICDVIVIGSGIIGAATAWALTRQTRQRVTLVEKGPLVSGMTRRSAGLVHPFHSHPLLAQWAIASYTQYAQTATLFTPRNNARTQKNIFIETGDLKTTGFIIHSADRHPIWANTIEELLDHVL